MLDESITTPEQCALAIALPLTQEEFLADAAPASNKDFVKQYGAEQQVPLNQLWENYSRYAALGQNIAEEAEAAGVIVIRSTSIAQWSAILRRRETVALFAHWKAAVHDKQDDHIELADGLHNVQAFVLSIPEYYCGVLDLTICYSMNVASNIKQRSPLTTVIVNTKQARLDYRLTIYRQVLRLLATGKYSYVRALSTVQLAVLNNETRWSLPTDRI